MGKIGETAETVKKQEAHETTREALRSVEKSADELREQMLKRSEEEISTLKSERDVEMAHLEEKAVAGDLFVKSEDKEELQNLGKEAEVAKDELKAEIGGEGEGLEINPVDKEELESLNEGVEKAKKEFLKALAEGDLETVSKIGSESSIPEEFVYTSEVKKAAQKGYSKILASGNFGDAFDIAIELDFSEEFLNLPENKKMLTSPEAQAFAMGEFRDRIDGGNFERADKIRKTFGVSDENVRQIASNAFVEKIKKGGYSIDQAREIKKNFSLPDEILSSPDVQVAIKNTILNQMFSGYLDPKGIMGIKNEFHISDEVFDDIVRKGFCKELSEGDRYNNAFKIKEEFSIPDAFLSSPEAQESGKQAFIKQMLDRSRYRGFEDAFAIKEKLGLSDQMLLSPEVQSAARKLVFDDLSEGKTNHFWKVQKAFSLPDSFAMSSEVQECCKRGFMHVLSSGKTEDALKFKEQLSISDNIFEDPEFYESAKKGFIENLTNGNVKGAHNISQVFKLAFDSLEFQEAARKGFVECLKQGNSTDAFSIISEFKLDAREMEQHFMEHFMKETDNDKKTLMFSSYAQKFAGSERTMPPAGLLAWRNLNEYKKDTGDNDMTERDVLDLLEKIKSEIAEKEKKIKQSELNVPEGLGISMGTEIEIVLNGISRSGEVAKEEIIDLKKSIHKKSDPRMENFIKEFIDEVQPKIEKAKSEYKKEVDIATRLGVGKGRDAVHEFANKATDNYSVLLWEMQELGKLGFIDFDRKLIQWIEKGMHLTISGEGEGIHHDDNAKLLQRAMISTGWSANGLDAAGALEVVDAVSDDSKKLYKQIKGFSMERGALKDDVFGNKDASAQKFGVENRALNMNSFEHLARTLKSFSRLAIPLKAYQENIRPNKANELQAKIRNVLSSGASMRDIYENKELLQWLDSERIEPGRVEVQKLILTWGAFRESTVENFSENQSHMGKYKIKNPLAEYSSRDYTRLFGELDEVFDESRDDTGELADDALLPYHQKAESGSISDVERKLVISTRAAVEKILGKNNK